VIGQQRMLTPSWHLDLPSNAFVGGPFCLTLDFVFAFGIMIMFDTLLIKVLLKSNMSQIYLYNSSKTAESIEMSGGATIGKITFTCIYTGIFFQNSFCSRTENIKFI
jgi:hypothetical protein